MERLDLVLAREYVSDNATNNFQEITKILRELRFEELIVGNPYLLSIRNFKIVWELVTFLLNDLLSSSEIEFFDSFLIDLAVFIAGHTCDGHKSAAPGVDLEFFNKEVHYVVSVKSGPNWGNSSQVNKLAQDLQNAATRVKQSKHGANVQPVLGICYGKTKTSYLRGYLKVVGQNFWYLISENKDLYTEIIEPIGYRAQEHNEVFLEEKSRVINRFTKLFCEKFCDENGAISWVKLLEFNSGNYDLDQVLS